MGKKWLCHFSMGLITYLNVYYLYLSLVDIRSTNQANTNVAFLQIANFGHFDTFPDGWVVVCVVSWVGGGKIKIKDHLSPAEAEIMAELGNKPNMRHVCRIN